MTAHPGRLYARYGKSLVIANGNAQAASAYCSSQRWSESAQLAEIHKATVTGMGSDISVAQHAVAQDLAAIVNPLTVIGRLAGFRRIPSRVNCITQTAQTTAFWVGEGGATPLSKGAFTRTQLAEQRCSAITKELAMTSSPSAEQAIARDLTDALVRKIDATFLDPTNAGSPENQPASITRSAPQFVSTGSAVANIDADLQLLIGSVGDGGSDLVNAVFITSPRSAAYLAALRGSGGGPCFPGMGALGGTLLGIRAITSGAVSRTGSPQETFITLIDPSRVWLCDEGRLEIATTDRGAVEMADDPSNNSATGVGSSMVSLFQTESIAVKAVKYVNWRAVTAASAAATLTRVPY